DNKFFHCCFSEGCSEDSSFLGEFAFKIFLTLFGILLVYLIFYFGVLIRNNIKKYHFIGQEKLQQKTLSVNATGKAKIKPDMAEISLGMRTTSSSVEKAQQENDEIMSELIGRLKDMGIKKEDIQTTNYNVYPQYQSPKQKKEGEPKEYDVSQNVKVKIRDLDKTEKIISMAGELGVNNIGNLQFDIDDKEDIKKRARKDAIEKARAKADMIASNLGSRVVEVVSYNESSNDFHFPVMREAAMGGAGDSMPKIEPGQKDVSVQVNIKYRIKNNLN
ncbi:MAG: SIMPL domain-containing protein, partial [Candidatus Paceibacteria bacterium]